MNRYNNTGLRHPGMKEGGEAAYKFLHCAKNRFWREAEHAPESLPAMRERGHDVQHCRFCDLPLITRLIESTYHYGRFPLTVIEWP